MSHGFKATGPQPTLGLLLDGCPGRQIIGYHSPRAARANEPAQAVENLAQRMFALGRFFFHQRQVRSAKRPLFVADITRISFSQRRHPKRNAQMYLLCTDISRKKFTTAFNLAGWPPEIQPPTLE